MNAKVMNAKVIKKTKIFIDGVNFGQEPETIWDYVSLGFMGLIVLTFLPLWIWPWLIGKFISKVGVRRKVEEISYPCGVCGGEADKKSGEKRPYFECKICKHWWE